MPRDRRPRIAVVIALAVVLVGVFTVGIVLFVGCASNYIMPTAPASSTAPTSTAPQLGTDCLPGMCSIDTPRP